MNTFINKDFGKTILAAVLGSAITVGAFQIFDNESKVVIEKVPENYTKIASNVSPGEATNTHDMAHPDFSNAAQLVTPTVVHIRSTMSRDEVVQTPHIPAPFRDFFGDEFFDERGFRGQPQPSVGSGSGVIVSEDGYILTNNHVIDKASEVEVSLYDKRTFKAKVIGMDPSTDLALIQIQAKNLPKVVLGNSDHIKVGQWVLAVGNPFNLESTVTAGIVSAKGRTINILQDKTPIESFIQTDAAVNPGNSGGALVNLNGELIGINTAIATPTGTYAGYSFAVPVNIAAKVVEDLIKYGNVQRAFLGITIRDVNGKLAQEKGLDIYDGVYVDSLAADGAAKIAGIQQGDVITKVDDRTVKSVAELQEQIAKHRPGDEVSVVVNRKGSEKSYKIPLRNREGKTGIIKREEKHEVLRVLGADLENVSTTDRKKLGIEGGVRVTALMPGRLREQTDMKVGFIITKVNRKPVDSVDKLIKALESEKGGILLEGLYPGSSQTIYYAFGM